MLILYALFALETLNLSFFITVFGKQLILLGGSELYSGILTSTCSLLGLFWKPIVGNLSEEKGYKRVLIWCIIPCIFGNIVSCLTTSTTIFFVSRLCCALGSPVLTLLRTATTDVVKANASDTFNKVAAINSIFFMLGFLLSGHIISYEYGVQAIYIFNISSYILSLVLVQWHFADSPTSSKEEHKEIQTNIKDIVKGEVNKAYENLRTVCLSSRYFDILTIKTVLDFTFLISISNLGFRLRIDFDLQDQYVGYFMLSFSVLSMIANISLVKIDEIWKNKTQPGILYGSILMTISFAGLALSYDFKYYAAFFLIMAMVKPSLDSDITKWHLDKIGNDEKGIVFSSFDTVFSLTELISPITASLITEYFGTKINYWFSSFLVTLAVGILLIKKRREKIA